MPRIWDRVFAWNTRSPESARSPKVSYLVAACAECDQVLLGIVAQLAARGEMVDLESVGCSAVLAAPSIAFEHLPAQPTICLRLKP